MYRHLTRQRHQSRGPPHRNRGLRSRRPRRAKHAALGQKGDQPLEEAFLGSGWACVCYQVVER